MASTHTTNPFWPDDSLAIVIPDGPAYDPASLAPAPAPVAVGGLTDVLYLQEPGATAAISVQDLYQGQIGDCFLISSIGELALTNAADIGRMITSNSNGTEAVTLYIGANGQLPTFGTAAFKPVTVTVTNVFPSYAVDNGATQDVVGNLKEIWPQVLEKAVATLDGGYGAIANGGNPMIAMEELTGCATSAMSAASLTVGLLQKFIAAGDMIVMDTYARGALPSNLVDGHAYMFEKLTVVNGAGTVQLGNPWGIDQPAAIALSQLSKGIAEVDIGASRA